jgi:signal transduction histidine kinase
MLYVLKKKMNNYNSHTAQDSNTYFVSDDQHFFSKHWITSISPYSNFASHSTALLVAHPNLTILYNNESFHQLMTKKGLIIQINGNILDFFKQFLQPTIYGCICDIILRKESKIIQNAFQVDKQVYAISIHTELNGNVNFIFYKTNKLSEASNTINLLGTTFPNLPIIQFEMEMELDRSIHFNAMSANSEKIIPFFSVKKCIDQPAYFLNMIEYADRNLFSESCEKALLNDEIWHVEFRLIPENGEQLFFSMHSKFYISDDGTFKWFGFLENITSKKAFENEKSALIYETLDYERARFSMELHDGLAQYLVGLNLYLNQLEITDKNNNSVLEKCKNLIQVSIQQTRSLCYNLTPPELNNGFINALKALFDRLNGFNHVKCSLVLETILSQENLQQFDAYNVFRIIQEAINNALKYSNCSKIVCEFKLENNKQIIRISDDGSGFDLTQIEKGLGLRNMEQRAKIAKVAYEISSEISGGTSIQLIL